MSFPFQNPLTGDGFRCREITTANVATPVVTVNTITDDTGIKEAQDEYDKLMRNKIPKSKRK